jgi:UDP-glucose 4-epimerase
MNLGPSRTVQQTITKDEAHRRQSYAHNGSPRRRRANMLSHLDGSGSTRVVVTGGAGFIGSHLCEALLARDSHVTCVDNLVGTAGSTRNIDHLIGDHRFELVVDSVLDWASNADLAGVDCVFHQAASKNSVALDDPEHDLTVNSLGTLRLLLRCARDDVRKFVHASTGSVFGETNQPHDDRIPKRPVSLYGTSKLAGESYCSVVGNTFGLDYTVLRYYHVIGPRQDWSERGGVVPIFARRCLQRRPLKIYGTGEQTRSFTAVADIVAANLLASDSTTTSGQSFTCASGIAVSIRELAEFIIEETGSLREIVLEPSRAGDIEQFVVDNGPIRELGIEFDTDWRGLVRDVIAWIKASGAVRTREP